MCQLDIGSITLFYLVAVFYTNGCRTPRCLNYLYTAAFLEFCREKLNELGYFTLQEVRAVQANLGVPPEKSEEFYRDNVDRVISDMAKSFFDERYNIKNFMLSGF